MPKRPLTVAIAGWLFVIVGAGGILSQLFALRHPEFDARGIRDLAIVLTLRVMALVGGVFVLQGANWARWMLVAWMAGHIAISLGHSWQEAAMHAVMFAVLGFLLFSRSAAAYFRQTA